MKKIFYIFNVCLLFIGVLIFFYPTISNYLNGIVQSKEIENYTDTVNQISKDEKELIDKKLIEYNESLLQRNLDQNHERLDEEKYNYLLNVDGNGMIGYLIIKKINVNLPIYHGSSKNTLQKGVGHYEGSSFPSNCKSVHSVLLGHTGLPSSKIISDLDKIKLGDEFNIIILRNVYKYKVDQIKIVEPDNKKDLEIVPKENYVSIVTCTPYRINSHRLIVRGNLIEELDISDVKVVSKHKKNKKIIFIVAIVIIICIIIIIIKVVYSFL